MNEYLAQINSYFLSSFAITFKCNLPKINEKIYNDFVELLTLEQNTHNINLDYSALDDKTLQIIMDLIDIWRGLVFMALSQPSDSAKGMLEGVANNRFRDPLKLFSQLKEIGQKFGINHCINEYFKGVPKDDILA